MQNRPASTWQTTDATPTRGWDADRAPGLRLVVLWLGMIVPLLVVAVRMIQLQTSLRDEYVTGFQQTYETREVIPARDGRILAADGSVLAGDVERFDLQVHYRSLQEPADPRWLRSEALKRLSRQERRDRKRVEAEQERVLQQREALWTTLATLTRYDASQLTSVRQNIQRRVEQIRQSVLQTRTQRREETTNSLPLLSLSTEGDLSSAWERIRTGLAESPQRPVDSGPITEEEDFHTLATDVTADIKAEIEAHPQRYPGVRVISVERRIYPRQELASHLIGSRTPLTADEFASRRAADPLFTLRTGDRIGRSGLELQYDSHLRGVPGERRLVKNRRGEVAASEVVREPQHGRDLVLTLDSEVQQRAEQLLDEALQTVTVSGASDDESHRAAASEPTCPQGGGLVALDVHTGAILAAASAPRFDLNLLTAADRDRWNEVVTDTRKPLFPRVTQMALAPGSVFKIITAVAALESGRIHPDAPVFCQGFLDRPDQHRCLTYRHYQLGHGEMRLADALCRSCNVYFFTAARRTGPQPLVDWATRFGFGQPSGIDLPTETNGRLPSPDETKDGRRRRWSVGDTLGLSIGQSELLVTPLQVARAMAAVANGGQLVTPHLASEAGPERLNGSEVFRPAFAHPDPKPIPGLHPETLDSVREGLTMVVHDPHGTAFKTARLNEVTIAGKTGTAETNDVDHAWFAGYVPAEQPRIAFVIVLEHGGSGGKAAGPVAHQFVQSLLAQGLVTPTARQIRK